ncbi:hypothetical protein ACIQ6Y_27135 [Streptomyces sp. NPDC096205]|uniref:hypothetical protein n=1 Tax=Streptomyces sp. NPDC096205 TaxID=3366081 RepID=UPI00381020DC
MSTNADIEGPLPLPAGLVPEGSPAWDGERARHWTAALAPRWMPGRTPDAVNFCLLVAALTASGALHLYAGLPAWVAALAALHLVWTPLRPEAVVVSAPVAAGLVLVQAQAPLGARLGLAVVLAVAWALVLPRLLARGRQRAAAPGGVTAVVPDAAGKVLRGRFLIGAGVLVAAAGATLFAVRDFWDLAEDRQVTPALAWCVVGLGVTVVLSGVLARRRALALRAGPVPVLRVLVREGVDVDLEVFAADDRAGLRPLFTVATSFADEDDEDDEDDEGDKDDEDDDSDDELQALLDRLDAEEPGPLREAVLYGAPWDGAEVVVVSAADLSDEPPVTECSTGPVRPLSERAVRRRAARQKRAVTDESADRQRLDDLAASVAGGQVRRWRAGLRDWLSLLAFLGIACVFVWDEHGVLRWPAGAFVAAVAYGVAPHLAAWYVVADREGLWLDGLKGPRHIPWEQLRLVKVDKHQLKIDSTDRDFMEWTLNGNRWRRLERRLGRVHRQDRIAAELTALWQDPAKRPTEAVEPRHRGGPHWPYGLIAALAWAALLLFVLP